MGLAGHSLLDLQENRRVRRGYAKGIFAMPPARLQSAWECALRFLTESSGTPYMFDGKGWHCHPLFPLPPAKTNLQDTAVKYFTAVEDFFSSRINRAKKNLGKQQKVAISYADVQGYCRLMSQNEASTISRLSSAIDDMSEIAASYGGEVVETSGDAIISIFDDPYEAVEFAIEFQKERFEWRNGTTHEWSMDFRVGINIGKVFFKEKGIHGHHLNIAARIQEHAKPGGIVVSDRIMDVLSSFDYSAFSPLGKFTLRNIESPVGVYEVKSCS